MRPGRFLFAMNATALLAEVFATINAVPRRRTIVAVRRIFVVDALRADVAVKLQHSIVVVVVGRRRRRRGYCLDQLDDRLDDKVGRQEGDAAAGDPERASTERTGRRVAGSLFADVVFDTVEAVGVHARQTFRLRVHLAADTTSDQFFDIGQSGSRLFCHRVSGYENVDRGCRISLICAN